MKPALRRKTVAWKYPVCNISRLRMGTDGDGIRTLVVMEGCPLRCRHCINPFTWDRSMKSRRMTAKEIYEEIRIDRPYILATCGGITFGGGEPLLYPRLLREMHHICDPDMTINVETSLHVPTRKMLAAADLIDTFLVDIKTLDQVIYRQYTGKDNALVLKNLQVLLETKGSDAIFIRIPRIPGYTNWARQQKDRETLEKMGFRRFDLFTYRV